MKGFLALVLFCCVVAIPRCADASEADNFNKKTWPSLGVPQFGIAPDRSDVLYSEPDLSRCGFAYSELFRGMGDISGQPLELRYQDSLVNESSAEWNDWHKRVAEAIDDKFAAGPTIDAKGKLVVCRASYVITEDGKISSIELDCASPSQPFNEMVKGILASISENPVLKYPEDSISKPIRKSGRFSQNYGSEIISRKRRS